MESPWTRPLLRIATEVGLNVSPPSANEILRRLRNIFESEQWIASRFGQATNGPPYEARNIVLGLGNHVGAKESYSKFRERFSELSSRIEPTEWWITYGESAPELRKIATKLEERESLMLDGQENPWLEEEDIAPTQVKGSGAIGGGV
ncbi:hypothetical protein GH714_022429 [Hevea brasiliensis]|uniref:Uncharacterized protein n=1 Tax=Hevea brasiliensis TaxID=3981 RepID=A0A6A6MXZ5_HEVBR|nr:hypothetical protein GH714_022429 [Hevea brasiliensis]